MYIVIMRIPDPRPLGLTFLLAMIRATDLASFLNVPSGGYVDTVCIFRDHLRVFFFADFRFAVFFFLAMRQNSYVASGFSRSERAKLMFSRSSTGCRQ